MSIWLDSCKIKKYPTLNSSINCDICIIGGGITGITTAYYLTKKGFSVSILEQGLFGNNTTGNTTGKITSQHNLFYDYLYKSFGLEFAKDYFNANKHALSNIKEIIDFNNINCDFEIKDSYVFTQDESNIQKFKDEFKALKHINPHAALEKNIDLPLPIKTAIKFPNQAQFNSIKYINGLLKVLEERNVNLYENSKALNIEKNNDSYSIITQNGIVTSKYVVSACSFPFINFPGFHFIKMYQSTAYAIAVETNMPIIDNMYINFETPTISYRTALYKGKKVSIIAGFDHKTGIIENSQDAYLFLEQVAKNIYPDCNVISKWATEDCVSVDKLPYIGEFSTFTPHIYLATGFKKWGMTTSNITANIICDDICGIQNKYAYLFNSKRFHPIKNFGETKNNIKEATEGLVFKKFVIKDFDIDKIPINSSKVFKHDGSIIGIYKDDENNIHAVKPVCSHLGCLLSWNNTLKTWDCPCHGSRYDIDGNCVYGPSNNSLKKLDFE